VLDTLNTNAYTKCKLKYSISIMAIYESYGFEFSVSKDMKKKNGGGSREDSGTFMSDTDCQGIGN
jgi:hypothetical protein